MATLRKGWQQVPNQGVHFFRASQRLSACAGVVRGPEQVEVTDDVAPTVGCPNCELVADKPKPKAKKPKEAEAPAETVPEAPAPTEAP